MGKRRTTIEDNVAENELEKLLEQLSNELPREKWKPWPGGRKNQIEAALIDAVLSIQANYGSEGNGVRGAVNRYAKRHDASGTDLNDLTRLVEMDEDTLQDLLNDQVISGRTKASAIKEAAANLVSEGVRHADDLDVENFSHKKAYTGVHGLGAVTWEYLGMLLGKPGVKADTWICRFVGRGTGHEVSPQEAKRLVMAAAERLAEDPTHLDHAIWAYERQR
jgi:endonuclease III